MAKQWRLVGLSLLLSLLGTNAALATQTGSWSGSGSSRSSNTGGNVTSVTLNAVSGNGNQSRWSLDGNSTLLAPGSGYYVPDLEGDSSFILTFEPGNNGNNTSRRVTFTFSNPVTDPVLHIDRLGGYSGSNTNSAGWTLNVGASDGATSLTKIAGVSHLTVDNGGSRFRGSFNQSPGGGWDGECRTSYTSGAACGSIRVNGTFTVLAFDVQMLGPVGSGDAVELAFSFNQDLGDAPQTFGRAIHAIPQANDRYLGAVAPDDDPSGNEYSSAATGDGADEDLVLPAFYPGVTQTVVLPVVEPVTGSSYLQAWIDWNGNGSFNSGEQVASNVVNNGAGDLDNDPNTITLDITPPNGIAAGARISRWRWSTASGLSATAAAGNGEVEDHSIVIADRMCNASASQGMVIGGTANMDAGSYQITLTEDTGNQAGAAWSQDRISLALPFTMEFAVYLGTKDSSGADGIAFAFHNDPGGNTVTGIYGGALGVGGLAPAVAIEFDTYQNGSGYGDIANDHTSIYNPVNYTDNAGGGNLYSPVYDLGNIEDGEWHDVRIVWDPITKTLQYYFDNVLVTTLNRGLVASDFDDDPNVYYGFTGSTGGSSNLQKACLIAVPDQVQVDYGDAPESFGNPSHAIVSGIQLGAGISAEATGYDDVLAAADDFDDGVIFPAFLPGLDDIVVSVQGTDGYLQGWIDWNQNGVFDEPAERIATDLQDTDNNGEIRISIPDAPPGAASGNTYARFRWSTTAGLGPTGGASDGEVEDYRLNIRPTILCPTGSSLTGGGIASGGDGPYRDAVYWLDWACAGTSVFTANSYVIKTWQFGPVEIRARLHEISHSVQVYNTGDWTGDLLDDLYQGVNPIGLANAVSGEAPTFRVDWEVLLDGQPIPADIIVADAEDTDDGEYLEFETDGGPWEVFAVASQTNDLSAQFDAGGQTMRLASLPGDGGGSLLALTQNTSVTRHVVAGSGHQAMAFGVFVQVDHGDIAFGYPQSGGHLSRRVATGGGKPTSATDVRSLTLATLGAAMPYLGEIPPSPEDEDQNSPDADADGVEEDGVTFPTLMPGEPATIRIQLTEDNVGEAYVQGWIDWQRDGGFAEPMDQVALNLRDNGPLDNDPAPGWISLDLTVPANAYIGDTYARFRVSTTPDVGVGPMVVFDGEVEDYKILISQQAAAGVLSGRVFNDTGAGGNAHDGLQSAQESGVPGVLVQLLHDLDSSGTCDANDAVLASAITDGEGRWRLQPALADVGLAACIHVQTPASHLLVSENDGGHPLSNAQPDDGRMALTVQPFGTDWDNILFGLAPRATFAPDQLGNVLPGASILYPHRYTAGTEGTLSFQWLNAHAAPDTPGWSTQLYRDLDCDGAVNGADALLTGPQPVSPGEVVCLLAHVFSPADAPLGAQHSVQLQAQLVLANSSLNDTALVTDLTRVLPGQLVLEKRVRNIGPDGIAGSGDDVDAVDNLSNQALPGDVLRYRILFRNAGVQALDQVRIHDATPAFTALAAAAACPAQLPPGLSGCVLLTPEGANGSGYEGSLQWQFTGALPAGATGEVRYDVRVAD
ncbi:CshA/CshB family fibrillar adhesin-related protein [Isoalcanivorax pacificus]|nr:CshA/CshB family fibrillar adhesin-related protein [Isoalcanivorax pacificus]